MYDHDYHGATLGVLYGDKLVHGAGRGYIHGAEAEAGALVPALGLSKVLTAVAAYQLLDMGLLRLDDTVFGPRGILGKFGY